MKSITGIVLSLSLFLVGTLPGQGVQSILVSNYGAHPDDGLDDIAGIRAAIAAIPQYASNVILEFEAGVYDLSARTVLGLPKAGQTLFTFTNYSKSVSDLTIAGNGAVFLCHGFKITDPIGQAWYSLFYINGRAPGNNRLLNLHIQDLTVTMGRLPYTMGTCSKVYRASNSNLQSSFFDIKIDPSFTGNFSKMVVEMLTHYPTPGHPGGFKFFYVQDLGQPAFLKLLGKTPGGGSNEYRFSGNYSSPYSNEEGFRLLDDLPTQANEHGKLYANQRVLFTHHYRENTAIDIAACNSVEIVNTTIHHWAGMGIGIHYSSDLSFSGVTIAPDPQRAPSYPMSTTSDGIHLREISGTVQWNDCLFAGMGDDAFNIYTPMDKVYHGENTTQQSCFDGPGGTLEVDHACAATCLYQPGDLFEFLDEQGRPLGTDTLKALLTPICAVGADGLRLQFNNPLPQVSGRPITYICNLSQYPNSVSIQNCTVDRNQGNGFLVRRNVTIENCTVVGAPATAVTVGPSVGYWNEGPSGKQVTIRNCSFTDLGYGDGFGHPWEGAVTIGGFWRKKNKEWTYGGQGCVHDVLIDGCDFSTVGGTNVVCRSTNTITIQNCAFEDSSFWGYLLDYPAEAKRAAQSLLFFSKTGSVQILNNELANGASYIYLDRWEGTKPNPYVLSGNSWQ
ncbi:MAG TPA: right-handed parallel beta-helix repeat-containing protein [Planctomycetes bacterium]|nr:right-handed parallel beta-helix repeat-containing protein [Planctomycetota bacterium]